MLAAALRIMRSIRSPGVSSSSGLSSSPVSFRRSCSSLRSLSSSSAFRLASMMASGSAALAAAAAASSDRLFSSAARLSSRSLRSRFIFSCRAMRSSWVIVSSASRRLVASRRRIVAFSACSQVMPVSSATAAISKWSGAVSGLENTHTRD